MLNIKHISSKFTSLFGFLLVLNFILLSLINPAIAEQQKDESTVDRSDFGLPTHRRDGGSRGSRNNCVADAESRNLMALIPENSIGINASASPKLFFYVPAVNHQRTLEFVLRNEQDELVYEAFLSTDGSGIMSIEVPADVNSNSLEADQNYHWYLSMICDAQQRSRDIVVEGWMRQATIDSATREKLDTASSIEQAEVYNEQGFWYDALSVLAENKDAVAEQPLLRKKWSEMLDSVGLKELASEPFIEAKFVNSPVSFP